MSIRDSADEYLHQPHERLLSVSACAGHRRALLLDVGGNASHGPHDDRLLHPRRVLAGHHQGSSSEAGGRPG
eukprot:7184278-Alexandrium_andersonii.AAC.1